MLDPHGLYELADELPELNRPVLVHALTGFVDAGSAVQLAVDHLLETLDGTVVARFDVDQLLDYRSRRPPSRVPAHRNVLGPFACGLPQVVRRLSTP